jgi:hypothetical protein
MFLNLVVVKIMEITELYDHEVVLSSSTIYIKMFEGK